MFCDNADNRFKCSKNNLPNYYDFFFCDKYLEDNMRKVAVLILLICAQLLIGFEISGNPENWLFEDFIGFDEVGDCTSRTGDISSVFIHPETEKLFLRITFDDMYSHKSKIDNFANENMHIMLIISENGKELFKEKFDTNKLSGQKQAFAFLRTPSYNLVEFSIDWLHSKENLSFEIQIMNNLETVDSFTSDVNRNFRGGNCAFVHHGNQGLTYTEVFYGQNPQETSGFDEILEVHQATDIPGNFHMSGTLMPAAEWHNPEFNDWLENGVDDGYVSMLTSALGQHIMPFVQNDMNDWSVAVECDMVEYRYGYTPKVAWIPERVWLSPENYPDAGVVDWLGNNWEQHGVEAVILDDWPHCSGHDNKKIHWMNNGVGVNLRVIPIDNEFVGKMHYDADGAKNHISSTGQYGITVYGTDWEVAAEMNEHHDGFFLDNYESVMWYCYDNYPAINVWKLDEALNNPDFNGSGIDVQNGTYGLCGGENGYGGSNNSWYTQWASAISHSDYHTPQWNYGTVWNDTYNNLMSAPNNSLSQLAWYTLMINLHETGWHTSGDVADWEHRYSSHIKNANVYAAASRWQNGDYTETTGCYLDDIDHDGIDELVIHNDNAFFVFEEIGGKANWIFYKDEFDGGYSVVGSDVSYYPETDGDYNENSSYNHFAALSDVSQNMQHSIYDISVEQSSGNIVRATFSQQGVSKTIQLERDKKYLNVTYDFLGESGYVKSGWTPDLLDIIWSGKSHLQRMWGDDGSYCGQRNSANGATIALVLGDGGASHNGEFEGTLVKGDEIFGENIFNLRLFAGYTSPPYDANYNKVIELDELALEVFDDIVPQLNENALKVGANKIQLIFNESVQNIENIANYELQNFVENYSILDIIISHNRKVILILDQELALAENGNIVVSNVTDLQGNPLDPAFNSAELIEIIQPHLVGSMNNWAPSNHDYDLILNNNGVWEITLDLEIGEHQYKIIESDSWNGNDWPANNQIIDLNLPSLIEIKANCGVWPILKNGDEFVTHFNPVVVGDFISEVGGINWNPEDLTGEMLDEDGDGIYEWQVLVPTGTWGFKVVLNRDWEQDTEGNAGNYSFSSDGISTTIFSYDMEQNLTSTSAENSIIFGDVDGNGEVQAMDASLALQKVVELIAFESWQIIVADVDGNGEIQAFDASLILQFVVGIIDHFPIDE